MELELHGGLFYFLKKLYLNVSKQIRTKILDVDNVKIYKPAKSQYKFRAF
jgi:hypothetical protein